MQLELLEQIRRQATDPNLPRLIAWLAEVLDGHVILVGPTGDALAQSSDGVCTIAAPMRRQASRLASGELKSAVVDDGTLKARLLAIGPAAPHAVLATVRTEPYPSDLAEVVGQVADLVALLLPTTAIAADQRRIRKATAEVRRAIFQLLMGGQATLARRSAASIAPGVLTDSIRVHIVDCRPGNREHTAEVIETAINRTSPTEWSSTPLPGTEAVRGALVIRCPAYDDHLIVIAPADDEPTSADGHDAIGSILRKVITERSDHYLGTSETTALAQTADAYRDASHALSVARHVPERMWDYNGHAPIAAVLNDRAHRWAAAFLRPLFHIHAIERDNLINTVRVALRFPPAEAAKMLDVHRNTITSRVKRAGELLALDLGDVQARAVLDLALQIDSRAARVHPQEPSADTGDLEEVLTTDSARTWAETILTPLKQDRRDLRRTLLAWVHHNTDADRAADDLGVHPQTVRGHLRSAERLLQRTLLAGAPGTHDLVIALVIAGDIAALPGKR